MQVSLFPGRGSMLACKLHARPCRWMAPPKQWEPTFLITSPPTHLPQCQLSQNPTTEKHRKAINCNGQTPNDCCLHKNTIYTTVTSEPSNRRRARINKTHYYQQLQFFDSTYVMIWTDIKNPIWCKFGNQKSILNKSTFPRLVCGDRGGVSPPVGPGGHIGKLLLSLQGLHLHKYYVYIFTCHISIPQE